ncbi:MAG: L,D-transpeptidase [Candidatus Komeilibacteria bacterium]|nr:L,D-transpeptidase [Candidatus Komeilibacteria bacterium]
MRLLPKLIILLSILIIVPWLAVQAATDADGDGLTDDDEINIFFTDPTVADTDGDGFSDGQEIAQEYSPRQAGKRLIEVDSDDDYLNDAWELIMETGLMDPDSDGDLYLDGTEVAAGFDPRNPKPVQLEKRIEVNLKEQRLTYFFDDKKLDSFLISGGIASLPTPKGEFKVMKKFPLKHYRGPGYDYPNTKWNLLFTIKQYGYYIHGAYWHNNFGRPMSHGCVNVAYKDMEHLYWWAQTNTEVLIY